MFKTLFTVFFGTIKGIVEVLLTPINLLVANLIPDITSLIAYFNSAVDFFLTPSLNWFFSILPSNCRTFILLYLTFLITYYTISISAHAIFKVYTIIRNVKFW